MPWLTKSRYVSGRQCTRRLHLEAFSSELRTTPTLGQERLFAQGREVGERARLSLYPGGASAEASAPWDGVRLTNNLLAGAHRIIYEAAFLAGQLYAKVDILEVCGSAEVDIIEVKGGLKVKDDYLYDLAFQCYVVEQAGITVRRARLVHLNRDCRFPNLSDLFVEVDVTDEVYALLPEVSAEVAVFQEVLAQTTAPDVPVGSQCSHPYDCPFKNQCWKHVPEASIFTIPRLRRHVADGLSRDGVLHLDDLPAEVRLTGRQQQYVELMQEGKPKVDRTGLLHLLAGLQGPEYYLDFETLNPAIPRFEEIGPYQQFPFQFSLHIRAAGGTLAHREYLHGSSTDPRPSLAETLVHEIGETGTVIVYNASFERRVIVNLAVCFPDLAPALRSIATRLWDLHDVFSSNVVQHPGFRGSTSLKRVLPTLVPELAHDALEIGCGDDAGALWEQYRVCTDAVERAALRLALNAYCELDTFGMVRIVDELRQMACVPIAMPAQQMLIP